MRCDLLEDAQAALHHQAQLPAGAARHARAPAARLGISARAQSHRSRTSARSARRCRAGAAARPGRRRGARSRPAAGRARPRGRSTLRSCQKLISCSARADRVGLAQRRGVADAVQVQQQPADRVGRAAAVVEQLGAVGVARVAHVLLEGVEQVVQQRERQRVLAAIAAAQRHRTRCGQRAATAAEPAASASRSARYAPSRPARSRRRGVAFVGDVVGGAREAVDRRDRRAQRRRAQQRGDGKVLVVVDAHRPRLSMAAAADARACAAFDMRTGAARYITDQSVS